MTYESLKSIYYKRPNEWMTTYLSRFNSDLARQLHIRIHQFGRKEEHPTFYCYAEDMSLLLEQIMSTFSAFQNTLRGIPGVGINQFLNTCLISEIKSSNAIEGVRSTRKEIRAALAANPEERIRLRLGGIVSKYSKIINKEHLQFFTCEDIRSFFDEFLFDEINRSDPSLLPDGRLFRSDYVDVVTPTQKIVHRGIYPEDKIIQCMNSALEILHDPSIPYFNRIAIFHFLFGYIHPFYDGNGRMSRFITSYLLANRLHPMIALQLSVMLKSQCNKYYDLFSITEASINRGDLTPFIIGTLKFIHSAIDYTESTLKKKLDTYRKYQQKISALKISDSTTLNIYDILLQAAIFSDIGATSSEIQATICKSENTITTRLKQIPEGLLKCVKTSRPYHYSLKLSALDSIHQ